MRRAALIAAILLVAAAAGLVVRGSTEGSPYRVAAVFDTARGMVPGQQVKVAGAVVGEVEEIELAPGPKARMVLSIERRFKPFHADASCRILPEGLISENYVDCDPGTPGAEPLSRGHGGLPTVPVERTAVPVSLQDVIDAFSLPVAQRLRTLIDELGLATAGRGEDLNAILRRANPALAQSRRVLAIVDDQRRQLTDAVGQTDRVLAELADGDQEVRRFVDRAGTVAGAAAEHRTALGEVVRELPTMLDALRPGLRSLDRAVAAGSPLLDNLRASAPQLTSLTRIVPAFSEAGAPAFRRLAAAARTGRAAVRSARPVVAQLRTASASARPFAEHLEDLLVSTRDQGGVEGLLRTIYSFAAGSGAYDETSHLAAFAITVFPQCFGRSNAPGCSHRYGSPGAGTIPVNDPSCGPQPGAPWDPPSRCQASGASRADTGSTRGSHAERNTPVSAPASPAPGGADRAEPAGARESDVAATLPAGLKYLLDYLLK